MSRDNFWSKSGTAILLVLIGAAILRLSLLGSKSLWFDEAFSVDFAQRTLQFIWEPGFKRPETHPPLYYHGLHYWIAWFGDSETSVRLPSALISIANVGLIYLLGRRLFNHRTGIVAAALLAFSPLHLWYAQEARMSVFMTTVLLLSSIMLTWNSWLALPILAATWSVGFYIDYTMAPIWALLSAIWVVGWWQRGREPRPFLIWSGASLFAWLAFAPWLSDFYAFLEIFATLHLFIRLNEAFGLPILTPRQYLLVMIIAATFLVPIIILIQTLLQREGSKLWVSTAMLIGFTLATLLFPLPRLYSLKRVLVQVWPLAILMVSWALEQMGDWRQRLTWGLIIISLAATLVTLLFVSKDDWRAAVGHVNKAALENDVVWVDPNFNSTVINYYNLNPELYTERTGSLPLPESSELWFFAQRFPGDEIPSSATEQLLDDNLDLVEAIPFYRLEVRRYRAKAQ